MPRTEKYFIGPQLLGDIRQTVSRVSAMPQGSRIGKIPTRLQDMPRGGGGGGGTRIVVFEGSWNKFAEKQVRFVGTTQTATAVNLFATVGQGCGERFGAIAKDSEAAKYNNALFSGNEWYLVAAEFI